MSRGWASSVPPLGCRMVSVVLCLAHALLLIRTGFGDCYAIIRIRSLKTRIVLIVTWAPIAALRVHMPNLSMLWPQNSADIGTLRL